MKSILAIDQGTTSTRALIIDANGQVAARAQVELPQSYPRPGWVEHDPETIWRDVVMTGSQALAEAEARGLNVAAIGIANQRETFVLWDRSSGKPVHPAIVWQDRRGADLCDKFASEGLEEEVCAISGLVLDSYFSASKLAWLLDTMPGLRQNAEDGKIAFGTIDCYLLWRLTRGRVHATDPTNAARTLLFDIARMDWSDDLCRLFGVPRAILPQVRDNDAQFGVADASVLGKAIPVMGMAGDQQAALIGQGCLSPGRVKITYGTGAFGLMHTGESISRSRHRLLSTVAYRAEGRTCYALEGSIFVAGAGVQWLRDRLGIIATAEETEALARSLPGNDGVYLVPAFAGLGTPHWDSAARALLCGMTLGTGAAHVARALLEAVAYQSEELVGAMRADSGLRADLIRIDGGMAQNDWLCQFLADVLALPISRPANVESTALGAAFLAGTSAGIWSSLAKVPAPDHDADFEPTLDQSDRACLLGGWRDAVARARHPAYQ
ncbi:glycerol kinase GlpK [Sphingobium sp. CCH11-B1]|jgi:glycerol kinase|uniref:glycerol kinase GlpK n=1 Tax=Sphingobium sp. CCH11-B1 TaxID=1768781 RepID=UPI00082A5712|nr:glycerol kinase GlpK [Sphingobium sp. CCH11-B1]MEA3390935.1 glycerol kinase GlpK [Pseudomonadota bacterium]